MKRIAKAVAAVALTLILLSVAADWFLETRWRTGVVKNGEARFLDTTADALERSVRTSIPLGSTRQFAEEGLQQQGLRFSYEAKSRTLYASARNLKGSNWLVESGVSLQLHFDVDGRLAAIEARVENTGP